jgi:hypothetical protein
MIARIDPLAVMKKGTRTASPPLARGAPGVGIITKFGWRITLGKLDVYGQLW